VRPREELNRTPIEDAFRDGNEDSKEDGETSPRIRRSQP
jgi:hypothetical protein